MTPTNAAPIAATPDESTHGMRFRNARRAMSPMYFRGYPATFWLEALNRRTRHGK